MADTSGKLPPHYATIKQLVVRMLTAQDAASLSLTQIGIVLKVELGRFPGRLKKILEHYPADFLVNANEDVILLSQWPRASKPPANKASARSAASPTPQLPKYAEAANLEDAPIARRTRQAKKRGRTPLRSRNKDGRSPPARNVKRLRIEEERPAAIMALADSTTHNEASYTPQRIEGQPVNDSSSSGLITTQEQLTAGLRKIAGQSVIALDCEGCNLSRFGRVCLIQVAIPSQPPEVFLFDLVGMDAAALQSAREGLGKILADPQITKVIHDCRQGSDALYHQLGISLDGVFDTQASYVALMKARKARARSASGYVPLPGLNKLLKEYAGKENEAKQEGKTLMDLDPLIWEKRPLPPSLIQYAVEDVAGLFAVRDGILADYAKAMESQLSLASAEYTSAFRNMRSPQGPPPPRTAELAMVFDESGSLTPVSSSAQAGIRYLEDSVVVEDRLEELLKVLPEAIANDPNLSASPREASLLMEIVLDCGRRPVARFLNRKRAFLGPETAVVSQEDLENAIQKLGAFGSDNRAGIGGTLHRISALRERHSRAVLGLTYRVGRAVIGAANPVRDLLSPEVGGNVLILGPPMTGKTTIIRDMARLLSKESWVVIVDTSNEIAGGGAVPHGSVGNARRMQVKDIESQSATMIECVQNHAPEVIIIDEIGRRREADAARTIAQRGVRLVSSAHGSLASLVSNPFLSGLLGGVDLVLVGDEAANQLHNGKKNVRQRMQDSVFQTVIELSPERLNEWAIYTDVEAKVDKILKGEPFDAEIRCWDASTGQVKVRREMRVPV